MKSIIKNMIEYIGLHSIEEFPINPEHFKLLSVQEDLVLMESEPDIGQIIRIITHVNVTDKRIIDTPVGNSLEGKILTGKKLIIEGELVHHIEYASNDFNQSVHAAFFNVPFSTFVVLPNTVEAKDFVKIVPILVDVFIQRIDKRTVFMNAILFLEAKIQTE